MIDLFVFHWNIMWVLLLDLLCHLTWGQKEAAKLVETSQPMPVAYALYVMGHFMELFLVIIMLIFVLMKVM